MAAAPAQRVRASISPMNVGIGIVVGAVATLVLGQMMQSGSSADHHAPSVGTGEQQEQQLRSGSQSLQAPVRQQEQQQCPPPPACPTREPYPEPSPAPECPAATKGGAGGESGPWDGRTGALPMTVELAKSAVHALDCEGVCDLDPHMEHSEDEFVPKVVKPMTCQRVMLRMLSTCPATKWPPARDPPADLVSAYTMNGKAKLGKWYMAQRYDGAKAMVSEWKKTYIDKLIKLSKDDGELSVYGIKVDNYMRPILQKYKEDIDGKVGMVIGTEKPWVEAHLLATGAKQVVTLEYGRIKSLDDRLTPVLAREIAALYLEKGGVQVDFVMTYSSLEHSGMGRYGDALNPFGDFEAMAQSWCMLKPGGLFLLGVPTKGVPYDEDVVMFNAHRHYGRARMAHMAANFDFIQVHTGPTAFTGEIFAMRKPMDSENKLFVSGNAGD